MNQASSLAVLRTEAQVKKSFYRKIGYASTKNKMKKSVEHHDSQVEEANDPHFDSKTFPEQLAEKTGTLNVTMSNLVKLIDAKFQMLQAKVHKLQTDVSFMHSRSMQGTPPLKSIIQVVFLTDPNLLQLYPCLWYLMLKAIFTACGRACDYQKT